MADSFETGGLFDGQLRRNLGDTAAIDAPHIVALRNAIDLGDTGAAIDLVDKGVDPEKHEAE